MVSVLMCTYNRRFCLKQAIDSVLCQTYPDFEFVIVDDGSTDGTEELIKSYQDPRIRYFKLNRNSFYCYAANQGWLFLSCISFSKNNLYYFAQQKKGS